MKSNHYNHKITTQLIMAVSVTFVFVLVAFLVSVTPKVNASFEQNNGSVNVFIGDISRAPDGYVDSRMQDLQQMALSVPKEHVSAVVGFNRYCTKDEIQRLVSSADDSCLERVYMWTEGDTGRLSLYIGGKTIEEGISDYKNQVDKNSLNNDIQFSADYQRFLNGEFGIFAITISCSAESLCKLAQEYDIIEYVDIKHNKDAEDYAISKGFKVNYIELPSKPDGTL